MACEGRDNLSITSATAALDGRKSGCDSPWILAKMHIPSPAAIAVETAVRVGAKPLFVVINNEGIAGHMIQDAMLPPNSPMVASLLPARYEKMAEMVDGHAEYVEEPDQIRPALDRAMASGKLAVVHVRVDPKATRTGGSNYLQ